MPLNFKISNKGFSLFEIMVVLAILGMVMGIVIATAGSSAERNLKKTSNRLASTIRYLYNKSAIEGIYMRLVFDLDERSYWVEATSDPVALEREDDALRKERERDKQAEKETAAKDETKENEAKDEEAAEETETGGEAAEDTAAEGEPEKLTPPKPKFSQMDSFLLRPTKLPSNVFIKDMHVEHRSAPVDGGQESVYFFPNGYVEKAVINLRDEKDSINYSIETNSISGQVNVENEYRGMGNE